MKINKSLDVDLNIISPQKHIRIHEGDVDSVDILIGVSVDEEDVDLDGLTIKYDATINNYLAEQDAVGSVVDNKISIPVTQNMAAMSGLLLIDVRMIQNNQILFTQTICATVEKAVVNEGTYIDFDKITIIQRMNALEEKMDYIETIVENFDTSKLIVSVNRPPKGAPAEVDVDLLRVGDTWIEQGENIVYKLVAAQYNYQPVPSIEPYHNYTWQPLNERHGVAIPTRLQPRHIRKSAIPSATCHGHGCLFLNTSRATIIQSIPTAKSSITAALQELWITQVFARICGMKMAPAKKTSQTKSVQ